MGKTSIEWTDVTWNPLRGCSKVSAGCANCYAEKVAKRFSGPGKPYEGTITNGHWNGQIRLVPEALAQPLKWREPRRVFVNSMSDLFHEQVPFEYVAAVFGVMAGCPQHTFQVLTKRPERMLEFFRWLEKAASKSTEVFPEDNLAWRRGNILKTASLRQTMRCASVACFSHPTEVWPLPNVHLGVSVENQATADERIPLLLQAPAKVRFLSMEPLLGLVKLPIETMRQAHERAAGYGLEHSFFSINGIRPDQLIMDGIGWVIVGGESGPNARPMHPDWARKIRDDCKAARVPFFFKQWGEWATVYDRDKEDPDWGRCDEIVRWTPGAQWLNIAGGQGFHGERVVRVTRLGKHKAGRLLNGVEHNEFPRTVSANPYADDRCDECGTSRLDLSHKAGCSRASV